MKVRIDPALFRPVTIRLENQDELDQLLEIISSVAANRINNTPPLRQAATDMLTLLKRLFEQANEDD